MQKTTTSELLDRLPPQDLDAEKQTLGSMLFDSSVVDHVTPILKADDFYADANKKLYAHIVAASMDHRRLDATILTNGLKQHGDFEAIGGAAYLVEVAKSVPYAANAVYYAKIVKDKSVRRNAIHALTEALRDSYDETQPLDAILTNADKNLSKIELSQRGMPTSALDASIQFGDYVERTIQNKESFGLATGFYSFDSAFGGMFNGELTILAARPSMGKSALALQIADYNAKQGRTVYYVTIEMSVMDNTRRLLCSLAGVNSRRLRRGEISTDDQRKLSEEMNRFGATNFWTHDIANITPSEIRRTAKRIAKNRLDLIVIDYLQLMISAESRKTTNEKIGEMTRELKIMARELNVPVLCLSQLNRAATQADKPRLDNLRDSGCIEQDADNVWFLYRGFMDEVKNKKGDVTGKKFVNVLEPEDSRAIWDAAKQRNDQCNVQIKLDWRGSETRFYDVQPENYESDFDEFS